MLNFFPCDRQLDKMDCGLACLKMITKYYNKHHSLQYLREQSGITREGVSLLDLGHAAEQIGLRSLFIKCTMDDLIGRVPLPAIAHWDNSHFIVVHKTNLRKGYIYVADPSIGLIKYTQKDFASRWIKKGEENKGVLMVLEPRANLSQFI